MSAKYQFKNQTYLPGNGHHVTAYCIAASCDEVQILSMLTVTNVDPHKHKHQNSVSNVQMAGLNILF